MAKTYHAINRIRHGMGSDGEQVFEPGEQVKGLDKDTMLDLWNAGVLEERDSDAQAAAMDERDKRIAELEAQLEAAKAEAAEAAKAAKADAEQTPESSTDAAVDSADESGADSGVAAETPAAP